MTRSTHSHHHAFIDPQNQRDFPQDLVVLHEVLKRARGGQTLEDTLPLLIEKRQIQRNQPALLLHMCCTDHVPHGLEESADLQMFQLRNVLGDVLWDGLNEGCRLLRLLNHELLLTFLTDPEEGVYRHLLHPREGLVHKLEEFEDHRLEELPMGFQESRILTNHIHDVAGHSRLIFLAFFQIAEFQQISDHRNHELLLFRLLHGAADRTNGPTQVVQHGRTPALQRVLPLQTFVCHPLQHQILHVFRVQVGQVDQGLAHHFVQCELICILLFHPHNVPLLVFFDGDLWRLHHLRNQHLTNLRQQWGIEFQPFPLLIRIPAHAVHQQRGPRAHGTEGRRLVLQIHARAKGLPKLHTDLEGFFVGTHGDPHQILQGGHHISALSLHSVHVMLQEAGQEQCHLIVEDLPKDPMLPSQPCGTLGNVLWQLLDLLDDTLEAKNHLRLVLLHPIVQASNLVEAFGTFDAILQGVPEVQQEHLDQIRLEDEAQGDPLQEVG
mmetsp:Transcript_76595/g.155496  ORF Transcript_76595/g.155496 Transcript_76595/m.155496 type:complete len:494 (+) Transcript_76595:1160-2641(+)